VPLLNTCLDKSRPCSSNKHPAFWLTVILCSVIISPVCDAQVSVEDNNSANVQDTILDVLIIDYPCDVTMCEGIRAETLIEYYGADWCEPCETLELMLDSISDKNIALIHHHPSVNDQSYLNHSKVRFAEQYRLIFIPSIVVDSDGLLTGAGQGAEVNQSMAITNVTFSGIDNLSISNGILNWNTSSIYDLQIWKLESVKHEFDNRMLNNTATDMMIVDNQQRVLNISDWVTNSTSRLVFILQSNETSQLRSLSSGSTGAKELSENDETLSGLLLHDGSYNAAVVTFLILLLCLLPALISFHRLQKQVDHESE